MIYIERVHKRAFFKREHTTFKASYSKMEEVRRSLAHLIDETEASLDGLAKVCAIFLRSAK